MKRMLDQKTIDNLKALLSQVSIDDNQQVIFFDNVNFQSFLKIPSLEVIVDEEGNPLFPLENNAGKVLAVNENEDGLKAVEVSGGIKLYAHTIGYMPSPSSAGKKTCVFITSKPTAYQNVKALVEDLEVGDGYTAISKSRFGGGGVTYNIVRIVFQYLSYNQTNIAFEITETYTGLDTTTLSVVMSKIDDTVISANFEDTVTPL